ncbi:tRNA (5-methylaminomethyl-2-thiouridylate)-methyltransferase [Desulfovibrio sp. X2]|uniref:tRNA (5-methylaminomethyl-2-thiouridylate)-methyltransferase n=1 Tax=Desulfovibrio sp. X2 TaxID=941449 RepID=UPI0005565E2D|nr:tRNA (5-methylaminomethyl-2-thiouridylate)-methyltransferase [Desulfovibrio sp. X2]
MTRRYDALSLFSGGLDSLLAHKLIERQGLRVLGLHFVTPFFGKPEKLAHWREIYGVDVTAVEVGDEYLRMLLAGPVHGLGSNLNPCMDCKVLMLRRARAMLAEHGAKFVISGEVVGQRPMSQRRDALNAIRRDAGVKDLLLRPLSALVLEPTPMEESGLVDRARLLNAAGRGRAKQLALAREFGITEIPTPGGGCRLTEREPCSRYAPILRHMSAPTAADMLLANTGRQFWSRGAGNGEKGARWLVIGRHQEDNEILAGLVRPGDLTLDLDAFPSPLAVARPVDGRPWDEETVRDAAAFLASYSPKAVRAGGEVDVQVRLVGEAEGEGEGAVRLVSVLPSRTTPAGWSEPCREDVEQWKKEQRERA